VQFRPACTAVSVAGVTIFTTFSLQPTKCNFLRYVCGRGDGGRKRKERRKREPRSDHARGKYCRREWELRDGRVITRDWLFSR